MKSTVTSEVTIVIELERGEWVMRAGQWSIARISFTVRKRPNGEWTVRIDHENFKAYERRWTIKDSVAFSAGRRFPGFFPRREDLPGSVLMALDAAFSARTAEFPTELPRIDEGHWSQS